MNDTVEMQRKKIWTQTKPNLKREPATTNRFSRRSSQRSEWTYASHCTPGGRRHFSTSIAHRV